MTVEEKTAALSAEEKSRNANFQLVEHLCSQFLDFAKPLLNSAFDKADDSLFDQADRSENNSQQQAYFEKKDRELEEQLEANKFQGEQDGDPRLQTIANEADENQEHMMAVPLDDVVDQQEEAKDANAMV